MDQPTANIPPASAGASPLALPEPRHPGVWSGIGMVVLYFLLQFGLSLFIGALIGFAFAVKAGFVAGLHHTKPDTQAIAQALRGNPDIKVILVVITIAVAAVIMTLLVRRFWPAQWSRAELPGFGFTRPNDKLAYPGAVALGILVLLAGSGITHLLAGGHPVHQDVTVMASKVPTDLRVLLALLVVCVAPFVEEMVFRGMLLSGLASRLRIGWAIVASAVIFGCAHLPDFKFAWYPVPSLIL
ncbi:MAG: lysostaphin resistance A-like protein, partial [Rhodanobacteraceae bacterium]